MTKEFITERFLAAGIEIDEKKAQQFSDYCDLLVEWAQKINLTAITEEKEIVERHFIDSLLPLRSEYIKNGAECADVGTGAGFPGVPIAIMRPDIKMELIDSLRKRLDFLNLVIEKTGIENCETRHIRAEDAAKGELRERFDIVFSRAVARTVSLTELCLPLVREGGYMLALKSIAAKEELEEAKAAIDILGGDTPILFGSDERNMVIIKKIKKTPKGYPRKAGKATSSPIRGEQ
ncbi:MAG: 16S rRNA (guanine(527)-N(7))-methyltransferase RsmG [Ruminococcaceae bacterium]|nr:16S rRNA (guanine(527)-N(7))-methyltransferase RsmG [Oscillospiraceae bacterium]